MKKTALIIISLVVLVMGILALIPSISIGSEPMWHAILKVIIGIIGILIAYKKD